MTVSDSTYRTLKRLQLATGVVPIGLFLLLHLLTNGQAIEGPGAFNGAVARIWRIPHLPLLETLAIVLPLLAHIGIGLAVATAGQAAEDTRGFPAPWMQPAQRATGLFLVVYVVFHVWSTRLSPARLGGATDLFLIMAKQLAQPGWMMFQMMGVIAAAVHFGSGLVACAGPWGLALGTRGTRVASRAGVALAIAISLVGVNALLAFLHPSLRWLAPSR
jgi:succinate dehydrogenase / fumarate reductase cytochrome b subunit